MAESLSLDNYIDQRIAFLKAEIERLKGAIGELENLKAVAVTKPKEEQSD